MKNSFLFIACIYLLQTYNSLNAQVTNKHYFGAEAGIYGITPQAEKDFFFMFKYPNLDPDYNGNGLIPIPATQLKGVSDGVLGYSLGLTLDYALSRSFAIVSKGLFQSGGFNVNEIGVVPVVNLLGNTTLQPDERKFKVTINSAQIDLLLRYQLSRDKWYLLGGVSTILSTSAKINGTWDITDAVWLSLPSRNQTLTPSNRLTIDNQTMNDFFKTTRFDLKLGLGTFIPLSDDGLVLTPELSTTINLGRTTNNEIKDLNNSTVPLKTTDLFGAVLSVGIKVPIGGLSNQNESGIYAYDEDYKVRLVKLANGKYTYIGTLTDSKTDDPISANITVTDLENDEVVDRTHSNSQGKYIVKVPKKGKYSVTADADGYVFTSELVEFDENGNAKSKSKGKVKMIKVDEFGKTQLLVFFDTDKSILQRESFTELKHAAGFIKSNPNMRVEIAGHTDNSGTREHNLDLSKRRAIAVYENLISKGVNPDQLTLLGYASDYPISDNNTEDGRAENRRVEFVVKEFKK